jgi:hypothetical protein
VADNVKGLTVELGGETRGLDAALTDLGKRANTINKELGQIERGLKFDPSNTVLLSQKQGLLGDKIAATRERLDALRQAQERVESMYKSGEIDAGQYRAFQRDLTMTESKLDTFEGQLKDVESAQKGAGTAAKNLGDHVDKAADKAKASGGKFDSLKSGIKGIGAAIAASAIVTGMVAFGQKILENADNLQVLADKTGLTAERLQELQYIGADVGVELDMIAGAQAKLTKAMFASKDGTGVQAEAFKALGISVVDSNGNLRDAKTVMGEAFTALSGMGNETERDALSMALFARGAQELNPLIKLGADGIAALSQEARDNGAVMSNEAVAGLDKFGDTLDQVKQSAMAQFGEWFSDVLPDVQGFLDMFRSGGPGITSFIPPEILAQLLQLKTSVDDFSANTAPQIKAWFDQFIGPTVDKIKTAFGDMAADIIPTVTAIVDFVRENWPAIQKAIEPVMTMISNLVGGAMQVIAGVIKTVMAVIRGDWGAAWDGIKIVFSGFVDMMKGTTIGMVITNAFKVVKDIGGWFSDMRDKVLAVIKDLLAKVTAPIDAVKDKLATLNPFMRHSPSLVDNILAGVEVIRRAYEGLSGLTLPGPMLATASASLAGASGVARPASASGAAVIERSAPNIVNNWYAPVRTHSEMIRAEVELERGLYR